MSRDKFQVVTGAFGYSGRHLTARLLDAGVTVKTLTGHPDRPDPFAGAVAVLPFSFDAPEQLCRSLQGANVLYNTYWVRFDSGRSTHSRAVHNTKVLFDAAQRAGVERVVHVSITNPTPDSALPYFRGKAELEQTLARSGLSHAILRPAVLFGGRDVLINNIAWLLRRLPLFGIPGRGDYRVQPIHVEDLARLMFEQGRGRDDVTLDAVGPECFSYIELVRVIAAKIHSRARLLHLPPWAVLTAARLLRWLVRDVVLTRDEIDGLMADLLVSTNAATGTTRFTEWLDQHAAALGVDYANELQRHFS